MGLLPKFDYRFPICKTGGCSCLGCLSQLLCLVPHLYQFLRSLLRIVWRIAKKGVGAREIIAESNVTRNANNETPRSTHTTCQLLLIIHPWRGCRPGGRSLANREKFHAATTIDNRCNRFGDGFGSRVCL